MYKSVTGTCVGVSLIIRYTECTDILDSSSSFFSLSVKSIMLYLNSSAGIDMLLVEAVPLLAMLILWALKTNYHLFIWALEVIVWMWSCVQHEVSYHLQNVIVVLLQPLQVRRESHFNKLVDWCLQAPQCQLVAFLCHVSHWVPTANASL